MKYGFEIKLGMKCDAPLSSARFNLRSKHQVTENDRRGRIERQVVPVESLYAGVE